MVSRTHRHTSIHISRKYYFTREESNCKLPKNLELKWKLWNMRKVEPSILYASWFSDGNVFIFHVSAFVSYLLQLTFSHFCLKSRLKTESWLCSFQNAKSYQQQCFLQIQKQKYRLLKNFFLVICKLYLEANAKHFAWTFRHQVSA